MAIGRYWPTRSRPGAACSINISPTDSHPKRLAPPDSPVLHQAQPVRARPAPAHLLVRVALLVQPVLGHLPVAA
jgi:hypothetical protein